MTSPELSYHQWLNLFVELHIIDAADVVMDLVPEEIRDDTLYFTGPEYWAHAKRMGMTRDEFDQLESLLGKYHSEEADEEDVTIQLDTLQHRLAETRLIKVRQQIETLRKNPARDRDPILNLDYHLALDRYLTSHFNRHYGGIPDEVIEAVLQHDSEVSSTLSLPRIKEWNNLTITFTDDDTVEVRLRGKEPIRQGFKELGFKDKRNTDRPNLQWEILKKMAAFDGELPLNSHEMRESMRSRTEGRIRRLRKTLQTVFRLEQDPISKKKGKPYQCRFQLSANPYVSEQFSTPSEGSPEDFTDQY